MWAITSYFNPAGFKSRLPNYRAFRSNLAIPLVTVELSFDGRFELAEGDADILVQISGGAVLWQKERLLNIALQRVPAGVGNVAWIDGDLIFERSDWVTEAAAKLEEVPVVQLLTEQVDLEPDEGRSKAEWRQIAPSGRSAASVLKDGKFSHPKQTVSGQARRSYAWGCAWAARRSLLDAHGFYDGLIVGGASRAIAGTMTGQFEEVITGMQLGPAHAQHYLAWARPFHRAVDGRLGFIDGRVYHLWHGDIENRNYGGRYKGLVEHGFEPDDIAIGANGAWHWARSKPDLERYLMSHFITRAEDG